MEPRLNKRRPLSARPPMEQPAAPRLGRDVPPDLRLAPRPMAELRAIAQTVNPFGEQNHSQENSRFAVEAIIDRLHGTNPWPWRQT